MVNYTSIAVGSGILLIVGLALIVVSNSVVIPAPYRTFLGIPYETNPEYAMSLVLKGGLMIVGILFIAFAGLYAVGQLAFGQSHPHPLPLSRTSSSNVFCIYCGSENSLEADYCQKCGKKLQKS